VTKRRCQGAVPVRPVPPSQATSTRDEAHRSNASRNVVNASGDERGSRKSGQAIQPAMFPILGMIYGISETSPLA
jgi:hypothetical protein